MTEEYFDVLIIGGGICGISAAYHIKTQTKRSFVMLEGRTSIGGTWDMFKYPGLRSDSDMYTFGFSFRPWTGERVIAPGPEILQYMKDTVRETGIEAHTRCNQKVTTADFDSTTAMWHVTTATGSRYRCNCILMTTGYFRYDQGFTPCFEGRTDFEARGGIVVHPQEWEESIQYAGKRVVVIGSGATAATVVPVMAETAAHVTMLQRSPGYLVPAGAKGDAADYITKAVIAPISPWTAFMMSRWKYIWIQTMMYRMSRTFPGLVKRALRSWMKSLVPASFDSDTHFNPSYNPWDERICACPDGDFFKAIRKGKVSVVTDHVECLTTTGVKLKSGIELPADIVVTATGFSMQSNFPMNDIAVTVDGVKYDAPSSVMYKDMMLSDVPNLFTILGYLHQSLTLKAELVSQYVCRILNHMDATQHSLCCVRGGRPVEGIEYLGLRSGYLLRGQGRLPKMSAEPSWGLAGSFIPDRVGLAWRAVDDGALQFAGRSRL